MSRGDSYGCYLLSKETPTRTNYLFGVISQEERRKLQHKSFRLCLYLDLDLNLNLDLDYLYLYYNIKPKLFWLLVNLIILRHISWSHNFTPHYFYIYFLIEFKFYRYFLIEFKFYFIIKHLIKILTYFIFFNWNNK